MLTPVLRSMPDEAGIVNRFLQFPRLFANLSCVSDESGWVRSRVQRCFLAKWIDQRKFGGFLIFTWLISSLADYCFETLGLGRAARPASPPGSPIDLLSSDAFGGSPRTPIGIWQAEIRSVIQYLCKRFNPLSVFPTSGLADIGECKQCKSKTQAVCSNGNREV